MPDRPITPDDLEWPDYCKDEHALLRSVVGKTITHAGYVDGWPTIFFSDGSSLQTGGYDDAWISTNARTWERPTTDRG